ncbi:MAG: type II toxin-antitoxin system VapC family toxin [Phycisphaeraceae bacterium]|nr:type II toxin-antitoxin system VapC family toxin [Phycisphaeraceae bacterium]
MRPSVYIETSIVSYLTARPSRDLIVAGHQQMTMEWWQEVLPGMDAFVSAAVILEIGQGDSLLAAKRWSAIEKMPVLEITPTIEALAEEYLDKIQIPQTARADAVHLAMAVGHGMDYLLTWNCRHIASARVRRIVADINTHRGIATPMICTPEELMEP